MFDEVGLFLLGCLLGFVLAAVAGLMVWRRTMRAISATSQTSKPSNLLSKQKDPLAAEIDELDQITADLTRHQSYLQAIIDHTPIILFATDRQGRFIVSAGKGLETLDQKPGEIVGQSIFESYGQTPDILNSVNRALEGETVKTVISLKKGVYDTFYAPLIDDGGEISGVVGLAHNITDLKLQEEAIRQSQAMLQATVNALSAHITILNEDGDILFVNNSWRQFGQENGLTLRNAGVGSNYLDICRHTNDKGVSLARAAENGIRDVLAQKRSSFYLEYPCHSPQKQRWYSMRVTRFVDQDQCRIVIAHEDITLLKLDGERVKRERFLNLLNTITHSALETQNDNDFFLTLARQIHDVVDANVCLLTEWNAINQRVTLVGSSGLPQRTIESLQNWTNEKSLTETVLEIGQPLCIENVADSGHISPNLATLLQIRALLCFPLSTPQQKLGAMLIGYSQPRQFTSTAINQAEQIASQITLALDQVRLYKAVRTHADQLAALHETSKDVTAILDLDVLLKIIAERTTDLLDADKSLLILIDRQAKRLIKTVGINYESEHLTNLTYREVEDGISGWVMRHKIGTASKDIQNDARNANKALLSAQQERHNPGKSIAVAPLMIQDKVIGTLTAVNGAQKPYLNSGDLGIITMFANQAAIAIENARLFDASRHNATKLMALNNLTKEMAALVDVETLCMMVVNQLHTAFK